MSYYYLHILCEGQCEAQFVKKYLSVFLKKYNTDVNYSIITTNFDKKVKGGNTDYKKIKSEIINLLKDPNMVLTTFIDFYKLPNNFPQYQDCKKSNEIYHIKKCLENSFFENINNATSSSHINSNRFIPYIQLHEFETLLFADIDNLTTHFGKSKIDKDKMRRILKNKDNNPELINNNYPPSKIISELITEYPSAKLLISGILLKNINIEKIKETCPSFNEWLQKIFNKFNQLNNY